MLFLQQIKMTFGHQTMIGTIEMFILYRSSNFVGFLVSFALSRLIDALKRYYKSKRFLNQAQNKQATVMPEEAGSDGVGENDDLKYQLDTEETGSAGIGTRRKSETVTRRQSQSQFSQMEHPILPITPSLSTSIVPAQRLPPIQQIEPIQELEAIVTENKDDYFPEVKRAATLQSKKRSSVVLPDSPLIISRKQSLAVRNTIKSHAAENPTLTESSSVGSTAFPTSGTQEEDTSSLDYASFRTGDSRMMMFLASQTSQQQNKTPSRSPTSIRRKTSKAMANEIFYSKRTIRTYQMITAELKDVNGKSLHHYLSPVIAHGIDLWASTVSEFGATIIAGIIELLFSLDNTWTTCNGTTPYLDILTRFIICMVSIFTMHVLFILWEEKHLEFQYSEVVDQLEKIKYGWRMYLCFTFMVAASFAVILVVESGMYKSNPCFQRGRM
jgi:hypothetical protein